MRRWMLIGGLLAMLIATVFVLSQKDGGTVEKTITLPTEKVTAENAEAVLKEKGL